MCGQGALPITVQTDGLECLISCVWISGAVCLHRVAGLSSIAWWQSEEISLFVFAKLKCIAH